MYNNNNKTWRYHVADDGTITRGRAYRLPSDWTTDSWRHYWDGDGQVCFIDGGYRHGTYAVTDGEDTERAITAFRHSTGEGLSRLARRLAPDAENAAFIHIGLDRGTDCYALSWDGDPDGAWRDEIEAVYHGDIWRIEVQEYDTFTERWYTADEVPEEYYGEAQAEPAFEREFPLAEVPEALLVTSDG